MRRSLSSDAIVGLSSSLFAATLLVTGFSSNLHTTMAVTLLAGACWMSTLSTFAAIVQLTLPNYLGPLIRELVAVWRSGWPETS